MNMLEILEAMRLNGLHDEAASVVIVMRQRAELLEALKAAQKKGSRWHPADPVVLQMKAAINRAEAAE